LDSYPAVRVGCRLTARVAFQEAASRGESSRRRRTYVGEHGVDTGYGPRLPISMTWGHRLPIPTPGGGDGVEGFWRRGLAGTLSLSSPPAEQKGEVM
jgi:hypothetical protein